MIDQQQYLQRLLAQAPLQDEAIMAINHEANSISDVLVSGHDIHVLQPNGVMPVFIAGNEYDVSDYALRQILQRESIPIKYIRGLMGTPWGKSLVREILQEHFHNADKRYLLRMQGQQLRAALSSRYRRIHTPSIIKRFLDAGLDRGAIVSRVGRYENSFTIEMVLPEVIHVTLPPTHPDAAPLRAQYLAGARLRNSDYGETALTVESYLFNLVCFNGLVGKTKHRQVHVGGDNQPEDMSRETFLLETATTLSKLRDIMGTMFSRETVAIELERIGKAHVTQIDMRKGIEALPRLGLLMDEVEQIEALILNGEASDGFVGSRNNLYNLSQGVSRVAQRVSGSRQEVVLDVASQVMDEVPWLIKAAPIEDN